MNRAKLTSSQGTVEFGVVSEERPDYVADITEYPIEGGNQISDHAALRPVTLALTLIHISKPTRLRRTANVVFRVKIKSVETSKLWLKPSWIERQL